MKRLALQLLFALLLTICLPDRSFAGPATASPVVVLRAQARTALDDLRRANGSSLSVHWPVYRATPTMVRGLALALPGKDLAARARSFFARYPALVASSAELALASPRGTRTRRVLRFRQTYRGLPVLGAQVSVSFDSAGRIRALHSKAARVSLASTTPALTAAQALALVYRKIGAAPPSARVIARVVPTLAVLPQPGGKARLVYAVTPPMEVNPLGLAHTVDARSGAHLGAHRAVLFHAARHRQGVRR
ncbi:MAG: hypothetical protein KC503_21450 [Myxococcales bacterium]|nr:hypothetical protein [Myxococcales bacterium]